MSIIFAHQRKTLTSIIAVSFIAFSFSHQSVLAMASKQTTKQTADMNEIYEKALASDIRLDSDRVSDASSKRLEFLKFSGLKPGDKVGEIIPGSGGSARLYTAIVGENGHVYAKAPVWFTESFPQLHAQLTSTLGDRANVTIDVQNESEWSFSDPLDIAFINTNIHDLYAREADVSGLLDMLYSSLKPGGALIIADHKAVDGSGAEFANKLHRIDRQLVLDAVLESGFQLVEESDMLANPEDDRTVFMFDPSVRGKTDRFLFKFKKP